MAFTQALAVALPQTAGTFSIAPARKEIRLAPGQSQTVNLRLANFLGQEKTFSLGVSNLLPQAYGQEGFITTTSTGPFSFSNLVSFSAGSKKVANGQEVIMPVKITIPFDWPATSVIGLVTVGTDSETDNLHNARLNTSAGALFLIRVNGQTREEGQIEKFSLLDSWYQTWGEKTRLQVAYKNSGNVHLNPYGAVYLKSFYGRKLASKYLEPWFVLPRSIRLREVELSPLWLPGIYRADLFLNLGYQNQLIDRSFYFAVLPNWWQTLILLTSFLLVLRAVFKLRKNV
ncbi:MAG: hypothetical protein UV88_C0001G0037 [Parcubacteria group bacterium GW2011_GWA1_43_21]|nr:MAG: hypothetical protein UV50_C0002G0037 [Parcubacteria group bacterium GW2011_GWB1_42_9]KKT10141.1 MAG: hypothetical protein UV88_C0001G0037 [Parcubacteria group bacterium GW2011_GWA1_43_21]